MLRLEPVFVVAPEASQIVSTTGAITALGAAFVAAGQTDIKKILAFSTVSQLGLMVIAVGSGAYAAAFFSPLHARFLQGYALFDRRGHHHVCAP
jgi:NADH-quinone oxidoreductase subunit L